MLILVLRLDMDIRGEAFVNRLLLLLISFQCFSKPESTLIGNLKLSIEKKFMEELSSYAKKNKCVMVKDSEYAPYIVRDLEGGIGNKFNSAIFFCRKGEQLGVLIYIRDKVKDKISISKCPRYIPNIVRNETMGLIFSSNRIDTGLGMDITYYFCKDGKWQSGVAH